ncbi:MAG TPA: sigma-70 family RNA polymerase sigma factor [Methylomirabilota bacterium]|nr:sigma-70 family RNA polymerase sigma factor [Methylomirabilota bacterium]
MIRDFALERKAPDQAKNTTRLLMAYQTGDGPRAFCTTAWTVILSAMDPESADYTTALQKLCATYWFPLYAYARRKGLNTEDAQDAVQSFFQALLSKDFLNSVDRHKGKFRSFIVTAFNRFLINRFAHGTRLKRGGAARAFSLNALEAEDRFLHEPHDEASPDKLFDKNWAETVIALVLERLREEFVRVGEGARFDLLKPNMLGHLTEDNYATLGQKLALSEGGVKTVVRRMRLRFSALLREELLHTLANPDDLDSEVRHLLEALA